MKLHVEFDLTFPEPALEKMLRERHSDRAAYVRVAPALLRQDLEESLDGFEPMDLSPIKVTVTD